MERPSGDQMPWAAPVLMLVICLASPPSSSISHSWFSPERFDSNRIRLLSGLQRGWRSRLPAAVNCRGAEEPSVGTIHRWLIRAFFSRSALVTT